MQQANDPAASPSSGHYGKAFSRNVGILSEEEQISLRNSRVAIAGLGGVGGAYAVTLARAGVGAFHLADFDRFELANFNRQQGATLSTVGRPKTEVIREMILAINPEARIEVFPEGLNETNVAQFLSGIDLVMDGLDFYALPTRRILFPACEARGQYIVTSGPLGLTTTLHVFGPGAMPFEKYFDLVSCRTETECLVAFAVGVAPSAMHLRQINMKRVNFEDHKAPSIGTAIQLCAGLACTQAIQILLKRTKPLLAPRYFQFDPVTLRTKKGYLMGGNRHPIQRLKRWAVLRLYQSREKKQIT